MQDSDCLLSMLIINSRANCLRASALQVAIRNAQQGVFYFTDQIPLTAMLRPEGKIAASAFVNAWKTISDANEVQRQLDVMIGNAEAAKSKLEAANVFVMAHKQVGTCCRSFSRHVHLCLPSACSSCRLLHSCACCRSPNRVRRCCTSQLVLPLVAAQCNCTWS